MISAGSAVSDSRTAPRTDCSASRFCGGVTGPPLPRECGGGGVGRGGVGGRGGGRGGAGGVGGGGAVVGLARGGPAESREGAGRWDPFRDALQQLRGQSARNASQLPDPHLDSVGAR